MVFRNWGGGLRMEMWKYCIMAKGFYFGTMEIA
jgi:hypothetical protein